MTVIRPATVPSQTATWWPSRYGPDDQAGALNEITPAKVVEAVGLVRRGVVFDLATSCTRSRQDVQH
jgi:hypothetical protein